MDLALVFDPTVRLRRSCLDLSVHACKIGEDTPTSSLPKRCTSEPFLEEKIPAEGGGDVFAPLSKAHPSNSDDGLDLCGVYQQLTTSVTSARRRDCHTQPHLPYARHGGSVYCMIAKRKSIDVLVSDLAQIRMPFT